MNSDVRAGIRAELWDQLGDELCDGVDDPTIARFYRATGGNTKLTIKRLIATARWRAETKPDRIQCSACAKDPHSHYMHLVGEDRIGRPVFYSCFGMMDSKAVTGTVEHMMVEFERAIRMMPEGVETWVWLNDFHGFGLGDCNPGLARAFLDLSAAHYPERLGQLMVLDAPSAVGPMWNMLKKFVDPVTHEKIRFVPGLDEREKLKRKMEPLMEAGMVDWVLNEMQIIRNHISKKSSSATPCPEYDLSKLRELVRINRGEGLVEGLDSVSSDLTRLTSELQDVSVGGRQGCGGADGHCGGSQGCGGAEGHSHYGTASVMAALRKNPELLWPVGHVCEDESRIPPDVS
eukprot:gene8741-33601_t